MPILPPLSLRSILATALARATMRLADLAYRIAGPVEVPLDAPIDVVENTAWARDCVTVNTRGGVA